MKAPNILFFFPDQHRADWLGTNPDLPVKTPNLDRLCARGMTFTNAFTPSPLCAPARACMAAGRDYGKCGVLTNGQDYPLDLPTYYQSLRDQGYRVAGVGKFDLHKPLRDEGWGGDGSRSLQKWGFTEGIDNEGKFDGSRSYREHRENPVGPYLRMLKERGFADQYVDEHARVGECHDAYTTVLDDDAYCDNWLSENGLNFLRNFPKDQPWHLVINFTGPHNPMDVTAGMRRDWENVTMPMPHNNDEDDQDGVHRARQNYAAMVENIDRQVGRFLAEVEARGEMDNTLIVYCSDHGEMLGDHNRWGKSHWLDSSSRVPLIVAGPGIEQGQSDALTVLQDLTATFLDYADCSELPDMDGISLRPVLEKKQDSLRNHIYSGLVHSADRGWEMIYDGEYKYVEANGKEMLYHNPSDPFDDHNLLTERSDVAAGLKETLAAVSVR